MTITYYPGDATQPCGQGPVIIAHVCNDAGGWGRGFVKALSARWAQPEKAYRDWWKNRHPKGERLPLGAVQMVMVDPIQPMWVANMIGQHGWSFDPDGNPPIRYAAIGVALRAVAQEAAVKGATIHMPRIGCGLAGGTWDRIEPIIEQMVDNVDVFVYDLEP